MGVDQPDTELRKPILRGAVPVGGDPDLDRPRGENGWAPFDRMNLGDQRRNDQPGSLIDPLGQPIRIGSVELAAKYVVFPREQGVHHAQAEPPAFVEAGDVETVYVLRKVAVDQPEARAVAQRLGFLPRVAVDLGSIPPGRGDVLENWIFVGRVVRDLVAGDPHLGPWLRLLVA